MSDSASTRTWLFGRVLQTAPQVPARDRPIRAPGFSDLANAIGLWLLPQTVEPLNRCDDAEIVDGQNVGTPQPEHQEHLRRPASQTLDFHDRLDDVFIAQLVERRNRQLTADYLRRKVAQVRRLVPAQSRLTHLSIRQC